MNNSSNVIILVLVGLNIIISLSSLILVVVFRNNNTVHNETIYNNTVHNETIYNNTIYKDNILVKNATMLLKIFDASLSNSTINFVVCFNGSKSKNYPNDTKINEQLKNVNYAF